MIIKSRIIDKRILRQTDIQLYSNEYPKTTFEDYNIIIKHEKIIPCLEKKCIIVIPLYKNFNKLTNNELESIVRTNMILKNYDIVGLYSSAISIEGYKEQFKNMIFHKIEGKWLTGRYSYSNLCENSFFYEIFSNYDYMLICQTDVLIYKDELEYWCDLGYDYIGSPHYIGPMTGWKVGNGGFSLRKVNKFIELSQIKNTKRYDKIILEDRYFTEVLKDNLSLCPIDLAFKFGKLKYDLNLMKKYGYEKYYGIETFGSHNIGEFSNNVTKQDYKINFKFDNSNNKNVTFGFCSKEKDEKFYNYLKELLGENTEIINAVGIGDTKTLTQGLNEIIDKASNDTVVLCHNDISFEECDKYQDTIPNIFYRLFEENEDYGIIGVIGGSKITKETPTWYNKPFNGHYIQSYKFSEKKDDHYDYGNLKKYDVDVENSLIIDGMLIAIKKDRIKFLFNEENNSFHFYDTEFCLQNSLKGVKIGVTKGVLIHHFSEGDLTYEFNKIKNKFIEKYDEILPYQEIKTAICLIIKNENNYIEEFINYHINIGFDHFFIYDNNDINGEKLPDSIMSNRKVTVIDVRGKESFQCNAYEICYKNYSDEYDWIMFIDADEHLFTDGKNIKEILSQKCFDGCEQIVCNWRVIGDNNKLYYEPNKTLEERFLNNNYEINGEKYKEINKHVKCMLRKGINYINFKTPHNSNGNLKTMSINGYNIIDGNSPFQDIKDDKYYINHFITKSISEFIERINSKRADCGKYRKLGVFVGINDITEEKEKIIEEKFGKEWRKTML